MKMSLKASQYMMLRRTKVDGKTILDILSTQMALSLRFFMISFVSFTVVLAGVLPASEGGMTSRAPCRGHLVS